MPEGREPYLVIGWTQPGEARLREVGDERDLANDRVHDLERLIATADEPDGTLMYSSDHRKLLAAAIAKAREEVIKTANGIGEGIGNAKFDQ